MTESDLTNIDLTRMENKIAINSNYGLYALLKINRTLAVHTQRTLPVWAKGNHQEIEESIQLIDEAIQAYESEGYTSGGFDSLQRKAIAQYGRKGLLIEELRDSDNGNLPTCFNTIGNLLARYYDNPERDEETWLWTLESMKNALQMEIDAIHSRKRDYSKDAE